MGELYLEVIVDRLRRDFNVEVNVGNPQVAYRETISQSVEQEGKYIRQTGGRGQYGHVWLRLEPLERSKGFEFVNKVKKAFQGKDLEGVRKVLGNYYS